MRALFVNSGFLGHRSVAALLGRAARDAGLDADHVDLSAELSDGERLLRGLMCAGPSSGASFPGAALTLPRARHELHAGIQAARRIRRMEAAGRRWEVIHFHTQATAYGSVGRMRRTPSVLSVDATHRLARRGASFPGAGMEYGVSAALDRRVFREAAAMVAVSSWAADGVRAEVPARADRVSVLPYPAPLEVFPSVWAAERAGRPEGTVRVLFVGGDFARKGGGELLAAWREARFGARARLTVVTDQRLDLPPGVDQRRRVRAYTPDWRRLWEQADLFVLPTRDEAFGMVYQEAAAAGLPAIGTRLNAIPELIDDGVTGLLIPPRDVGALVEALRTLVDDAQRRCAMGLAARGRSERLWSPRDYAVRLGTLLRQAAG
jgi:starch synthase